MTDVETLRRVIREQHGAESTRVRSAPVHETFRGETVSEGVVEVFELQGHPRATTAYAWNHETDEGGRRFVAVLRVPPVNSAVDAVRVAVVAEARKAQE